MNNNSFLPLVSVVVITYNSSETVIETLESIKSQTYQNIELIVSDDCSTDETVKVCQEWINVNADHFVKTELVTAEKNTGVSGNLNRGIRKSHGEWIKSIAGDDLLIPTAIEEYVKFVSYHPESVRMCVSDVELFAKDAKILGNRKKVYEELFKRESEPYKQQRKRVMTSLVFVGPTYFYSRALFDEIGGFSEEYGNAEEWPFVYKIIMGGNRIYAINKKLVRYRVQASSLFNLKTDAGLDNKTVFNGMYRHYFDRAFKELLDEGCPFTAWHYALSFWSKRLQYHIKNKYLRKATRLGIMAFSPLVYLRKFGVSEVIV